MPPNWQQFIAPAVLMVAMLVMFWQVVIRPTQTRQKKHRELIDSLKPGDRVITVGGIYGKVVTLGEKSLGIEIARGITVQLDRRAVRRRQDQEDF